MPDLWNLGEFDTHDQARAAHLRGVPSWPELVRAIRDALRTAIETKSVRFGFDESGNDSKDLRGIVQFPLGHSLFDWFFNSTSGYRAQFRLGHINGLTMNAQLISEISQQLSLAAETGIVIHRFTSEFKYQASSTGTIRQIVDTLDVELSKVWACEKQITQSGQISELFVSRTGPKLVFQATDSWSSLYPEDSDGWLDVKGAFLGSAGPYQLKSPTQRAQKLEERGSA